MNTIIFDNPIHSPGMYIFGNEDISTKNLPFRKGKGGPDYARQALLEEDILMTIVVIDSILG